MVQTLSYTKISLVVDSLKDEEDISNTVEHLKSHYKIEPNIISAKDELIDENSRIYLLYLSDEEIKNFFETNILKDLHLSILPNEKCLNSAKSYSISKDIFEAIDDALNQKLLSKIDLLLCNGRVVFNKVSIGDMHDSHKYEIQDITFFGKIKNFLSHFNSIKYNNLTLTTSKDHVVQTAASGIMILEHTNSLNSSISEELSFHDGKLNAFILAPASLLSYFYYLILIFLYNKFSTFSLPKSLGFIRSSKLKIESPLPFDFTVDKIAMSAKIIDLEIVSDAINLHLGRTLISRVNKEQTSDEKDTVQINSLPKGEVKNLLIDGKVPFFKKADEDDFKDLFIALRASSNYSAIFISLMILSTLLATTGLFQNSAPVIIGAMVLAPLMSPIISLSMGIIRVEKSLINNSIQTLSIGIFVALLFSSTLTIFMPLEILTNEMRGRLNPNVLDLMVAVFSGIAGAYANAKSEVAKSLAGVAIAVALVPPLSVTGIGIGWNDFEIIYGSFLLFITNLIGITLSAALTFIVLGYSPVKRAKKGIIYTSILLSLITVPLVLSFKSMIIQSKDYEKISSLKEITINENSVAQINILEIKSTKSESAIIELEVISKVHLSDTDYKKIKSNIEQLLNKKVTLQITPKIVI